MDVAVASVPASVPPEYKELKRRIKSEGLLGPQTGYYTLKTITTLAMLAAGVTIAVVAAQTWIVLLDAVFMGFVSTQIGLLAHDVAHRQAFRGPRWHEVANLFFGNLLLGVSHTWWTAKHNQHHASPNHVDDDPDVNFPMLVFAAEQIATRARWLRPAIAIQAWLFVFILPFQSLNMRYHSVRHLWVRRPRRTILQSALLGVHFGLYGLLLAQMGAGVAVAFFCIHQATFGLYNSSVFASNHKGMEMISANHRLGFFREQVLTSRNVKPHWLTDFWCGGLNYQIEHHLFPTLPRNRLGQARTLVQQFCAEQGIAYCQTSLAGSYFETFRHLHRTSSSLRHGAALAQAAAE